MEDEHVPEQEFSDEFRQLEENILRMPLVVWDGTILDGHRYRICTEKRS